MLERLKSFFKSPPAPPVQKIRHRFVEFGAGWGDVVTLMYTSARYNSLENLSPQDRVTVVLMCHNPHVKELFTWHRNAEKLNIRNLEFWWPKDDQERRAFHKLPAAQPFVYERQEKCVFYPSPEDQETLQYLKTQSPYVLFGVSAGGVDRNIPESIYEPAVDLILSLGLTVVITGRSYNHNGRVESQVRQRPGVIDLVDRLSIPGTALAIERAAAVFCCHSAVCLLSWYMKKPVFLLYPKHVQDREFGSVHQYTFGKDWPTTDHMEFSEYGSERLESFIRKNRLV